MIYPDDFTKEDIEQFELEYNEWLAEELAVSKREREFLAQNPIDFAEEIYSPFWGAI